MFGTMRCGTGSRRHSRHGQMIEEEEKEFKDTPNYFISILHNRGKKCSSTYILSIHSKDF